MNTKEQIGLTEKEITELKDYYLDSTYGKYAINYIEDKYKETYSNLDLGNLDPEKEYTVVFEAVVVGMNEYDSLKSNMPMKYQNTKGNEGIFQTTLAMYEEKAHEAMREFINQTLSK